MKRWIMTRDGKPVNNILEVSEIWAWQVMTSRNPQTEKGAIVKQKLEAEGYKAREIEIPEEQPQ